MGKKILIIDDDRPLADLLRTRLDSKGYEVLTAHDGESGMALVKQDPPDLILLDVVMPKMDGYTFIRNLRREDETRDIPVIVVSGKERMKDLFVLEGITEYFLKPYKPEELFLKIDSILNP